MISQMNRETLTVEVHAVEIRRVVDQSELFGSHRRQEVAEGLHHRSRIRNIVEDRGREEAELKVLVRSVV